MGPGTGGVSLEEEVGEFKARSDLRAASVHSASLGLPEASGCCSSSTFMLALTASPL